MIGKALLVKRDPLTLRIKCCGHYEEDSIVGHVLSLYLLHFGKRCQQAFAEVSGEKVKRGAGYGLEIPCV